MTPGGLLATVPPPAAYGHRPGHGMRADRWGRRLPGTGLGPGLHHNASLGPADAEAAGSRAHQLQTVQLTVSLVEAELLEEAAFEGRGWRAAAAGRSWVAFTSAPLRGGQLEQAATVDLPAPLWPGLPAAQACLLVVFSRPGVTCALLSASIPVHGEAADAALEMTATPSPILGPASCRWRWCTRRR
ncbi:hypothetical protein Srufu_078750 [Streptomyces libani subsp. rufus]|nr:hypothetical protein Srufu_078750 [Streptomyces libani subsp. rufus]